MSDATNDFSADANQPVQKSASSEANQAAGLKSTYVARFNREVVLPLNRPGTEAVEGLSLEIVNRARARSGLAPLPA